MRRFFTFLALLFVPLLVCAHGGHGVIVGEVVGVKSGETIAFATISIDENHKFATLSDESGRFKLQAPFGEQRVVVAYMGYEKFEQVVEVKRGEITNIRVELKSSSTMITGVVVKGESNSSRLNKSAYSVQSMSLDNFKNSSANMTDALAKVGGVKIRETGGVGSDANISLGGFSGSHVKIFIDGVQLDQTNSAFSLSNMPANFADRIDVYSGVVPIEFGTDAIGGVINIVTKRDNRLLTTSVDASYSFGSFNTHSSYVNFSQVLGNGITYGLNFYQNYSDNDYWVDTTVTQYTETDLGYPMVNTSDKTIYRVRRFNDAYHNETGIATLGVSNKKWADALLFKFNYSQYNNEIQTGNRQDWVYGDKERSGYSLTPTMDYNKRDLFTQGLDLKISSNYSSGYTHNYSPGGYSYNWRGEAYKNSTIAKQDSEQKSRSSNVNLVAKYKAAENQDITLSNTFSSSRRITRSLDVGADKYSVWSTPKVGSKDIVGLSYQYHLQERFDATLFAKYYWQKNEGYLYNNTTGEYAWESNTAGLFGYGGAVTYLPINGLQMKLSYEQAYRLPTSTEVFGDEDLEVGTFDLRPESSDNFNISLGYSREFGNHFFSADGNLIYRYTRDYIVRSVSTTTSSSAAGYTNFGKVETKGYTLSARYNYDDLLSVGATFSNISPRNDERSLHDGSSYETVTYGVRIPNQPYKYANVDSSLSFRELFGDHDSLTVTYDLFYQHEFPLYWENLGSSTTKSIVPTQTAHNLTLAYSPKGGKYNFILEARNITDAKLYDNYSLQKAGRAFYAKVRVNIINNKQK